MEKKNLIIGIIILIIIGMLGIYFYPSEDKFAYEEYIFSDSELNVLGIDSLSPAMPTPDCEIYGMITGVSFVEAYDNPCLEQGKESCPTDTLLNVPGQYFLRVHILESKSLETGSQSEFSCENTFEKKSEQTFYILEEKVNEIPKYGYSIKGVLKDPALLKRFDSYTLKQELFI